MMLISERHRKFEVLGETQRSYAAFDIDCVIYANWQARIVLANICLPSILLN
jgi:hypothetical protein